MSVCVACVGVGGALCVAFARQHPVARQCARQEEPGFGPTKAQMESLRVHAQCALHVCAKSEHAPHAHTV